MGNWNPSKDREPDKKEEHAFRQFLISKYERRQWYKTPAEVKKENESSSVQQTKVEPKLQPPPPNSKVLNVHHVIGAQGFVKGCLWGWMGDMGGMEGDGGGWVQYLIK